MTLMRNFLDFKFFILLFSISYLKGGGFLDCWRSAEKRKLITDHKKDLNSVQEENNKYLGLSLDQLQSAFYLFFIMNPIVLITLITEFIEKI